MTLRRIAAVLTAAALAATACGNEPPAGDNTAGGVSYPMTLRSPFGETVLERAPERVAVITSVDLDIALALGVEPVISAVPPSDLSEYETTAIEKAGYGEIPSYDPTDGPDFEAIAEADPDVILATSGWELDVDYDRLAGIAPVVSYLEEDDLANGTWEERLAIAGRALNKVDEAERVVEDNRTALRAAREANPAFEGRTLSFIVIHPDQITYFNDPDSGSNHVFTELGFTNTEFAAEFTAENSRVSLENLDKVDADVLLLAYPFGAEGVIGRSELESNPLFTSLEAVKNGDYVVLNDDVPSSIAYPTPLSEPWVLGKILPELERITKD